MQNATTTATTSPVTLTVNKGDVKNDTSKRRAPSLRASKTSAITFESPPMVDADGTVNVTSIVGMGTLKSQTVGSVIEALIKARDTWEQNAFRKANDELYGILAQCLALYEQMAGATEAAKEQREHLKAHIEKMGYRFNGDSHTLTKIAKCVFGADRRRVSAYSLTLRAALQAGVKSADLPAFIREKGGVEEVRLASAPNAMTANEKAKVAAQAVTQTTLGALTAEALNQPLDAGRNGKAVVLLGTWQADGSVVVHEVIKSDGAIQAALVSYYGNNKASISNQGVEKQAANDADATADAVNAAVQNSRAA